MIFLAVRNLNLNGLPYLMPIHPNLVHFTIGLFGMAIAFDIIGAFYRQEQAIMRWLHIEADRSSFFDIGWWNLLAAAVVTFLTVSVGFFEILLAKPVAEIESPWGMDGLNTMFWHGLGGIFLLIIIVFLAVWRGLQRYRWRKNQSRQVQWLYLIVGILTVSLMYVQGKLGAHMASDFAIHNTAANLLLTEKQFNNPKSQSLVSDRLHSNQNPKSPSVFEAIATKSANLPRPKFSRVRQTLYYGIKPVLDLTDIDWEALLLRLNEYSWHADQFRLNLPESGTPTITLGDKPLLQPDPAVAHTWLYKLQQAVL